MTVSELIAELSKLDPRSKILVDYDYDHIAIEAYILKVYADNKGVVHIETTEKE